MTEPKWPDHLAGLYMEHNPHKNMYQSLEDWLEDQVELNDECWFDWASPEERQKAIDTDSIWTLQWYPNTPVGFSAVAASTLEAALDAANK